MRKPSDPEANEGLFALDRTFGQMAVNMGEATWSIPTLSQREKALLCLMTDICDHNLGLAFEMHIEMAVANDVSLADIREVIFHSAPEAGYTNALQSLIRFKEVMKQRQWKEPSDDETETQAAFSYDPMLHRQLEGLAKGFGDVWTVAVGQQWRRTHLNIKERALVSIAAAVSNQTLDEPFAYLVRMALDSGVTKEEVQDTIRFVAEFGIAKAWQALERLNCLSVRGVAAAK